MRSRAQIPNPALKPLEFLIGEWWTEGSHPALTGGPLVGRASFAWNEGGAFLVVRTSVDHPQIPDGIAFIASDDVAGRFCMSYFDERSVSRLYEVTVGDGRVEWRRDEPSFSQSTTLIAADGGERLVGTGRMSRDGGAWEDDLSQVYTRIGP
ncbi:MAG TPA: hypothetical protein VF548_15405 [Allosphingosinicella sp.]|jgi:hypothetical protein